MRQFILFIAFLVASSVYQGAMAEDGRQASAESKVLENFIGTWDEEMTNKPTEWTPKAERATSITKRSWSLGDKFVRAEGTWQPANTECLHLMTYDPYAQAYRSWYFDGAGSMPRGSTIGKWDEKTQTMTWRGVDEAGNVSEGKHRFIDKDHHEWTVVVKNRDKNIVLDLSGKSTRKE
jgi:hypothetical protein